MHLSVVVESTLGAASQQLPLILRTEKRRSFSSLLALFRGCWGCESLVESLARPWRLQKVQKASVNSWHSIQKQGKKTISSMYGNTRSYTELYNFDRSITKAVQSHNVKENEQKVANIKTVIAHKNNYVFDELFSNSIIKSSCLKS